MNKRKYLWDRAESLLLQLNNIKSPMQNEYKFTSEEEIEYSTKNFSLCNDLESLITDVQNYMKDNQE